MDCSTCIGFCTQGGPQSATVRGQPSYTPSPPKKKQTHLARGGLDGAGRDGVGGRDLALERPRNRSDLFALAELCLLLAPLLALLPGLARHAVGSESRADGEAPAREPGLEDAADDVEGAGLHDAAADSLPWTPMLTIHWKASENR